MMRARCRSDELAAALAGLTEQVRPHVLERVVLRTEDGNLLVALTRDGGFARARIAAEILTPGSATIALSTLQDIAERVGTSHVEIQHEEDRGFTFVAARGQHVEAPATAPVAVDPV